MMLRSSFPSWMCTTAAIAAFVMSTAVPARADSSPMHPAVVFAPITNRVQSLNLLTNLVLQFAYTNTSAQSVSILGVDASCHCTTPKIPVLPWVIGPHASGNLDVVVEIPGKWGVLEKTIRLWSVDTTNVLTVQVEIPEPDVRQKNRIAAFVDRQAVFKGGCAECHSKPAEGLTGAALFKAACAICHEAEHRASMVPDLSTKPHGDSKYWAQWIRMGKPGTFMPGFAKPYTGPLSEPQIQSLIEYLQQRYPPSPGAKPAMPLNP